MSQKLKSLTIAGQKFEIEATEPQEFVYVLSNPTNTQLPVKTFQDFCNDAIPLEKRNELASQLEENEAFIVQADMYIYNDNYPRRIFTISCLDNSGYVVPTYGAMVDSDSYTDNLNATFPTELFMSVYDGAYVLIVRVINKIVEKPFLYS